MITDEISIRDVKVIPLLSTAASEYINIKYIFQKHNWKNTVQQCCFMSVFEAEIKPDFQAVRKIFQHTELTWEACETSDLKSEYGEARFGY